MRSAVAERASGDHDTGVTDVIRHGASHQSLAPSESRARHTFKGTGALISHTDARNVIIDTWYPR